MWAYATLSPFEGPLIGESAGAADVHSWQSSRIVARGSSG